MQNAVDKYRTLSAQCGFEFGKTGADFKTVATPFLPEEERNSPAGAPGSGPVIECPY